MVRLCANAPGVRLPDIQDERGEISVSDEDGVELQTHQHIRLAASCVCLYVRCSCVCAMLMVNLG